ncbi:pyridoxal phosphate-dependent transferase [Penicillium pulvis]|uniref:pyridoxal phosphate-dependent transferase n=1 Tax=Penicillium pulvis TaxID=1562058 RepID=UPI002547B884|nr:pyridoxal phosphate-dependent transferase [Penicillium pulvis]KAJ5786777.1 pyridoxal phosphate-dependent transferase [Penicillium pulvis]
MKYSFGKQMREQFLFEDGWTNMNHGSFGAVPNYVRSVLHEKQNLVESTPDAFIRFGYGSQLLESRKAIAKLVHAPVDTVVLLPNASSGIDTILRNLEYSENDHILIFDTVYGTVERATLHLSETTGVNITRIALEYPISDYEVISRFEATVDKIRKRGEEVKVAVFDVVSFQPGVLMPFEALVESCRRFNVLSCVDGAHCAGQIPIDLVNLDPDFFVSNLHKWLFVPRGCAILYAPYRTQYLFRTNFPTSWGYSPKEGSCHNTFTQTKGNQTAFEALFESFGTMDYSAFLCIPAALRFREANGGEVEIMRYNSQLAQKGGALIAQIMGTKVLDNDNGTLTRGCSMVNVLLPVELDGVEKPSTIIDWISRSLVWKYRTFVPVFEHSGCLWIRASGQIYLEEKDFAFLGKALKDLCLELKQRRELATLDIVCQAPTVTSSAKKPRW